MGPVILEFTAHLRARNKKKSLGGFVAASGSSETDYLNGHRDTKCQPARHFVTLHVFLVENSPPIN